MTIEEALRILHCPSAYLTDDDSELAHTIPMFSKAYGQAMAVAFEALKQAPCEDAISRQAVMDALCDGCELFKNGEKTCFTKCEEYHFLATLPPVTPQPKTVLYSGDGYADGHIVYDMAECPNCGYRYEDGDKDWGLSFCPNCGQALNWESEDKE